ncbi:hypothetical protein J2746_002698 [Methanolobus bombayensis]|nr:hypothetical protein [Methanolobus bombayensis]
MSIKFSLVNFNTTESSDKNVIHDTKEGNEIINDKIRLLEILIVVIGLVLLLQATYH